MGDARRIVSLLPSATEMICALGLADRLFGITHECDFPPGLAGKTVVVRSVLPIERMSPAEIDRAVSERLQSGQSLYEIREDMVRAIRPDLVVTQDLCDVCAPSGLDLRQMIEALPERPEVLSLTPRSLDEIFENIRSLGQATGRLREAEALIAERRDRLAKLAARTAALATRPRVFCMEWLDPVYGCGHWVPEMVNLAGGRDALGRKHTDSIRIAWKDVCAFDPEVLIVMPCGYGLAKAAEQAQRLENYPGWRDLAAVRTNRVYAVDANAYFARPGPRVVDGVELLAHLIHPEALAWSGATDSFCAIA